MDLILYQVVVVLEEAVAPAQAGRPQVQAEASQVEAEASAVVAVPAVGKFHSTPRRERFETVPYGET